MAVAYADIPSAFYRVSLKALIFDAQKRLLVVKPGGKPWELPGGGWEHGESMQHCLRREIMEELSVTVDHIDFGAMYPYSATSSEWGYEALKLAIPVRLGPGEIVPGAEMTEFRFVTKQELATLEMGADETGIKQHIARIWG